MFLSVNLSVSGAHALYLVEPEDACSYEESDSGIFGEYDCWAASKVKESLINSGHWLWHNLKKCSNGSTLTKNESLEKECLNRSNSDLSRNLKLAQIAAQPALQLASFLYFGTSISPQPFLTFMVLAGSDLILGVHEDLMLSLIPPHALLLAKLIDMVANEIAAKLTTNCPGSDDIKDIVFFLSKMGFRHLLLNPGLVEKILPKMPMAGISDFPQDFNKAKLDHQSLILNDGQVDSSINLMWINMKIEPESDYVFSDFDRHGSKMANSLLDWSKTNPASELNLWFDSNFVSPEQITKTRALFADHNSACRLSGDCSKISLQDLSSLELYQKYSKAFIDVQKLTLLGMIPCKETTYGPKTYLWHKVDVLRLMASTEWLKNCTKEECYFVYADADIIPLDQNELFSAQNLGKVRNSGLAWHANVADGGRHENSFFMQRKNQLEMAQALECTLELWTSEMSSLVKNTSSSKIDNPVCKNLDLSELAGFQEYRACKNRDYIYNMGLRLHSVLSTRNYKNSSEGSLIDTIKWLGGFTEELYKRFGILVFDTGDVADICSKAESDLSEGCRYGHQDYSKEDLLLAKKKYCSREYEIEGKKCRGYQIDSRTKRCK